MFLCGKKPLVETILVRWQAIYLCEFDGPRERKLVMRTL